MTHYTRAQWGARAPRAGNPTTPGVKGVAVHYNGPAMGINPNATCSCAARVKSIQNFHMNSNGWADIAYDVIACPHGHTFQGRLGTRNGTGANGTSSANRDYKAVMGLIGDGETPTDDLKRAILSGIAMCRQAGAGPAITGHRDHQSTACPGSALYAWVKAGAPTPTRREPTVLTQYLTRGNTDHATLGEVTLLQKRLNAHGIPTGIDGSFGPATEEAVRAFQSKRGLDVDGKVGPATRRALNDLPPEPTPQPAKPEPERGIGYDVWSYRNHDIEDVDAYQILRDIRDGIARIETKLNQGE